MEKKLVPYSLYLYSDQVEKLKKMAEKRNSSAVIRDAVYMILDGKDQYTVGYNRGLADALGAVKDVEEFKMLLSINGKNVSKSLVEKIGDLKK